MRAHAQTDYPLAQAAGYEAGDLRGAIVVKRPLQ